MCVCVSLSYSLNVYYASRFSITLPNYVLSSLYRKHSVTHTHLHAYAYTYMYTHTPCRTYVSSRPLFQELNTLMAYLGAPTYRRKRSLANAHSTIIGSQLEEFLDSMTNECDEKTLRNLKAKEIFYQVGRGWKERGRGEGGRGRGRERRRKREGGGILRLMVLQYTSTSIVILFFRVDNQRLVIPCSTSSQESFRKQITKSINLLKHLHTTTNFHYIPSIPFPVATSLIHPTSCCIM